MNILIATALGVTLLIAVAFILLFRKLASRPGQAEPNLDWWKNFSLEKYRPMERLFLEEDFAFLSSQPGFTPQLARRLRSERRKIFRRYLRSLSRDFNRLYATIKLLLLHSAQDRPDLALLLFKQRLLFHYALAAVHCRLVLQTLGLGTVDARGLVSALGAMRDQLQALIPQAALEPVYHR